MSRALAGAAALALALLGCGKKSPAPAARHEDAAAPAVVAPRATTAILDSVQVELHGRAERVIDPRALGRALARCLIESGAPVAALAEQAPAGEVVRHLGLTLDVAVHEPDAERADLGATVDVAGRWQDDARAPAPAASLTGAATPRTDAPADVDPLDAAVAAVVLDLEPRVCAELVARLQLWAADAVTPGLTGDAAQVRWALALVAERRPPADPAVRWTLIGAIARHLGDLPIERDAAIAALVDDVFKRQRG